ncbi:hypothetical protein C2845_PM18G06890 [Panicum miliaceum]|uniref:Uncharacterized protein n=1 Tax=Panicum miliaceum TaxID=4540 RepID=A0A3L6PIB3_PANMI|nr:hypothetical protein C2845_PM18G06890 [Panicum miliaceum]
MAAHGRRRRLRLRLLSLSPSEPLLSPDPILCGLCGATGPCWLARVEPLQLCRLICGVMRVCGAGFDVIISIRPGNAPLLENHGFRTIKSFSEI